MTAYTDILSSNLGFQIKYYKIFLVNFSSLGQYPKITYGIILCPLQFITNTNRPTCNNSIRKLHVFLSNSYYVLRTVIAQKHLTRFRINNVSSAPHFTVHNHSISIRYSHLTNSKNTEHTTV